MMEGCFFFYVKKLPEAKHFFVLFETYMHIKLLTLHSIFFNTIPAIFYFSFFFSYLNHTTYRSPLADIFLIVFSFCYLGKKKNLLNYFHLLQLKTGG